MSDLFSLRIGAGNGVNIRFLDRESSIDPQLFFQLQPGLRFRSTSAAEQRTNLKAFSLVADLAGTHVAYGFGKRLLQGNIGLLLGMDIRRVCIQLGGGYAYSNELMRSDKMWSAHGGYGKWEIHLHPFQDSFDIFIGSRTTRLFHSVIDGDVVDMNTFAGIGATLF